MDKLEMLLKEIDSIKLSEWSHDDNYYHATHPDLEVNIWFSRVPGEKIYLRYLKPPETIIQLDFSEKTAPIIGRVVYYFEGKYRKEEQEREFLKLKQQHERELEIFENQMIQRERAKRGYYEGHDEVIDQILKK